MESIFLMQIGDTNIELEIYRNKYYHLTIFEYNDENLGYITLTKEQIKQLIDNLKKVL